MVCKFIGFFNNVSDILKWPPFYEVVEEMYIIEPKFLQVFTINSIEILISGVYRIGIDATDILGNYIVFGIFTVNFIRMFKD